MEAVAGASQSNRCHDCDQEERFSDVRFGGGEVLRSHTRHKTLELAASIVPHILAVEGTSSMISPLDGRR